MVATLTYMQNVFLNTGKQIRHSKNRISSGRTNALLLVFVKYVSILGLVFSVEEGGDDIQIFDIF